MTVEAPVRLSYLDATRPLIEGTIGRRLRLAEQVVDVLELTRWLDDAKDRIHAAIEAEKRRAINAALRTGHPIRFAITRQMLKPLEELYEKGRVEARAELERAGYLLPRRYADAEPHIPELGNLHARLGSDLNGLAVRVDGDRVTADLSALSHQALADALLRVPGGRSIAAGLVSSALFNGMGATFDEHADLVPCWEYSSALDGGTCPRCAKLHGSEYHSLDELFRVLPNFGPNPDCFGGDRCRCRAVPCNAFEHGIEPIPDPADEVSPSDVLTLKRVTRGQLLDRQEKIELALGDLDRLIRLPDRGNVGDGVKVTMRKNTTTRGHLKYTRAGTPLEINVASDTHAAVTFAHEFGHLLDLTFIGDLGKAATRNPAALEGEVGDALRKLDDAWKASNAYQTLEARGADGLARYMRSRSELWARSFSQWAGQRAGTGVLHDQIVRDVEQEAEKIAELGDVPGWRFYPETWQAGDFDAIATAVEGVLRAAHLLRE